MDRSFVVYHFNSQLLFRLSYGKIFAYRTREYIAIKYTETFPDTERQDGVRKAAKSTPVNAGAWQKGLLQKIFLHNKTRGE